MINKYSQLLIAFVLVVVLNACSQPSKEYILKVKLNKLTYEDMYNHDLITDVIFDSEELNLDSIKNISREAFLKGVDEYKNKHNPALAITFFKKSILSFPDAKTYYELGNALMESKTSKASLEEAQKAYRVAEALDIKPIYMVYYKQACAENMLHALDQSEENNNIYDVISYLRRSFREGFYDTLSIEKDERINSIISTEEYKSFLRELKTENYKGDKNGLFELYKAAYPAMAGEFEITKEQVGNFQNEESISYDFASFVPEMQNTEFGREVSNDFFYQTKVKETPAYTAVVYSSVSFWGGGEVEDVMPVLTSIVTYDPVGVIIDRKLIACQCSAEKIKTAKISGNNVYVEDFKRVWEQPIDKVSFDENSVKGYESLAKLTYQINEDGTITAPEIPANYIDTVITKRQPQNTPQ